MASYKFDWGKVKEDVKSSEKKKGYEPDSRFWKPTVDDKGNATAVIRFLPDKEGTPFIKFYSHNFNYMVDGVKKYWIRNCINTFGYDKECPICKKNQEYWNSSFKSDKDIASQRKRKLNFIANILVVKNPNKPEEEGKVFLYQFGQKIYDKIKDKMFPSDEIKALGEYDEYVPFDLYEGANFKLVQVKQGEYPNYDKSEFGKQTPVGSDKQINVVMEQTHPINEFIADDKFPTNKEVIEKLGAILGLTTSAPKQKDVEENLLVEEEEIEDITSSSLDNETEAESGESDEDVDFFKSLQ